jgi:hypothetical protein
MDTHAQFWLTLITPVAVGIVGALLLRVTKAEKENIAERDQRLEQKIDTVGEKVNGLVKGIAHIERQQEQLHNRITEIGQAHCELKGYVHAKLDAKEAK